MTATRLLTPREPHAAAARRRRRGRSRPRRQPWRDVARRVEQHERRPPRRRGASCRARSRRRTASGRRPSSCVGRPARGEQRRDLVAQRVLAGQPQRREQAERDRLAVAVARVAGDRLDRVADRVAEVEHLAQPAVALVGATTASFVRAQARMTSASSTAPARTRSHSVAAGDQRGLHAPRRSRRRAPRAGSVAQRVGVGEDGRRLVVGADVVLRLGRSTPVLPP